MLPIRNLTAIKPSCQSSLRPILIHLHEKRTPFSPPNRTYTKSTDRTPPYPTQTTTTTISTPGPFPSPNSISSQRDRPWRELNAWSRVVRTTRNAKDLTVIIAGGLIFVGVIMVMYTDIFQPNSKWAWFSHGVERIKSDAQCVELLGRSKTIVAHGDTGGGGWGIRDRGISAKVETDRVGTEHINMVFTVEGEKASGRVHLHVKRRKGGNFEYELLCLDVKGHQTVFLEDSRSLLGSDAGKAKAPAKKVLGIQWGW